jgi:hypothetical protein
LQFTRILGLASAILLLAASPVAAIASNVVTSENQVCVNGICVEINVEGGGGGGGPVIDFCSGESEGTRVDVDYSTGHVIVYYPGKPGYTNYMGWSSDCPE